MADIFNFYVYDDRSIRFELAEPIMLEDKDVTQFRFRIPKSLNGFDMSNWEWWFIFVNPKGTKYTTLLELSDDEDEPDEYSVATYTVGYGFSGIVGTVRFSIEALNVSGEEIVNEWHTKTYSTAVIDTLQGLRAVIPEPDGQVSTGITEEVKQALLQIARKVAYIDEHGQTYYNALYDALYAVLSVNISPSSITLNAIGNTSQLTATTVPNGANVTWTSSDTSVATVSSDGLVTSVGWGNASITATAGDKTATCSVMVSQVSVVDITANYIQSGTVYTTASLDDLKSDLTVSAEWSDGSSSIVADTDYTLSGTLTEGTSTVTVTYGGKTATFDVIVTKLYQITMSISHCTSSNTATNVESGMPYSTTLTADEDYDLADSDITVTMGGVDVTSTVVSTGGEITIPSVTGDISITAVTHAWVTYVNENPNTYQKGSGVTVNGNTVTLAPTSLNWDTVLKFTLIFKYSDLKTKRVRCMCDVDLTGYTEGRGVSFGPATFQTSSSGTRKAYTGEDVGQTSGWLTESGKAWFDSSPNVLADVLTAGTTPRDSEWVGASIYCNANSGCVAVVTNIKCQYLT